MNTRTHTERVDKRHSCPLCHRKCCLKVTQAGRGRFRGVSGVRLRLCCGFPSCWGSTGGKVTRAAEGESNCSSHARTGFCNFFFYFMAARLSRKRHTNLYYLMSEPVRSTTDLDLDPPMWCQAYTGGKGQFT